MSWDPIQTALQLKIRPVLRRGDEEWGVALLKRCLGVHGHGYDDWADPAQPVEWKFNAGLESRVRGFQREHGLVADGIVGPKTWAALCADPAPLGPELARMPEVGSTTLRERVVSVAEYGVTLDIREETNRNDGPFVEAILTAAGGKKGQPWCVAAVWCCVALAYRSLDRPAPDWPKAARLSCSALWRAARAGKAGLSVVQREEVQPGDVFLVKGGSTGHKHAGIVTEVFTRGNRRYVETAEGNTNSAGSAEGHGFFARERSVDGLDFVRAA